MFNFQTGKHVRNHLAGMIEVGYGRYGPTLAVSGTLTAVNKMALIDEMTLTLTSRDPEQNEQRLFRWLAFRPHGLASEDQIEIDLKMPAKFTVPPKQAHPYNIIFNDLDRIAELKPLFEKIKLSWKRFREQHTFQSPLKNDTALFQDFSEDGQFQILMNRLFELCYWQEGLYDLIVNVHTENPKDTIEVKKSFELLTEDIGTFRLNAMALMPDLCNQPADKCQTTVVRLS